VPFLLMLGGTRIQVLDETTRSIIIIIDIARWNNNSNNNSNNKDDFRREAALATFLGLPNPDRIYQTRMNERLRIRIPQSLLIRGGMSTVIMNQDYYLSHQPVSLYLVFLNIQMTFFFKKNRNLTFKPSIAWICTYSHSFTYR